MTETLDCGHAPSPHESYTTGYGTNPQGEKLCYECCSAWERHQMRQTGRAVLYLTRNSVVVGCKTERGAHVRQGSYKVTDWPGTLSYPVDWIKTGRHNIAGVRYDVWFKGPDGESWHGVQYGEGTQLCRCKRIKS